MKRKSIICLVLAVLMIIASFAVLADSNKNARKGLTVRELSLHKYNSRKKEMQQRRLPEPVRYSERQKSQGLTFSEDCFLYLKKHWPGDLQKILEAFSLSEVILYRAEHRGDM